MSNVVSFFSADPRWRRQVVWVEPADGGYSVVVAPYGVWEVRSGYRAAVAAAAYVCCASDARPAPLIGGAGNIRAAARARTRTELLTKQ